MKTYDSEIRIEFPLKQFVRQLFFAPLSQVVFNPKRFHYLHNLDRLESCWANDYLALLEICWVKQCNHDILPADSEYLETEEDDIDREEVDYWF